VLLSLSQEVERQLRESPLKIQLKQELLQDLQDWFAQTIITHIETREAEHELGAEYGLGLGTPGLILAKMLATLRAQIRASSQRRREIRNELERELSVFIDRLNLLIDDAQVRLQSHQRAGLVVIVDGLEKMVLREVEGGHNSHEAMFLDHAEQLCSPHCHLAYTVPISLHYNSNVQHRWDNSEVIPMVAIYRRDGVTPYQEGRDKLCELIGRRFDVSAVFPEPNQLMQLVEMSGGQIGDLLRLIRLTFDDSEMAVESAAIDRARRKLVNDYDRLVKDSHLPLLYRVHHERRVPGDQEFAPLLHNLLVLEYLEGEIWADVHPAVQATRKFREYTPPKATGGRRTAKRRK
jgi:hypothetical protein